MHMVDDEAMENFTMRIPKRLRKRIHRQAEREQRSDSQMGRILIEDALAVREGDKDHAPVDDSD
jgi:predicted pyridoxine 5'-phosphate oxidase superfamily flavin-nucleotide-binding protein